MSSMPPEVESYFASGAKRITSVVANSDYSLTLTFDNGETRLYNMRETVEEKPFSKIKHKFRDAFLDDCGTVAWDIDSDVDSNAVWGNRVDLCPDSCYIYSRRI